MRVFGPTILAVLAVCVAPTALSQVNLPEPVYQVSMNATYEPSTQLIQGVERIRWRNTSSAPVAELQFHLYLDAFADNRSTFVTESGGQLRGLEMSELRRGWTEVESMRLAYGADLMIHGVASVAPETAELQNAFPPLILGEPGSVEIGDRPDLKEVERAAESPSPEIA
jgi:hypothetical protein